MYAGTRKDSIGKYSCPYLEWLGFAASDVSGSDSNFSSRSFDGTCGSRCFRVKKPVWFRVHGSGIRGCGLFRVVEMFIVRGREISIQDLRWHFSCFWQGIKESLCLQGGKMHRPKCRSVRLKGTCGGCSFPRVLLQSVWSPAPKLPHG